MISTIPILPQYHASLIKSAVNRARALMRSGLLSDPAISMLRSKGHLPSIGRMTEGLDIGSGNIIRKHGIVTNAPKEYLGPGFTEELKGIIPNRAYMVDPGVPRIGDYSEIPKFYENMRRSLILRGREPLKEVTPEGFKSIGALIRRHEIDEAISMLRGGNIIKRLMKPALGLHGRPEVLRNEAKNVAGLDPAVRDLFQSFRRNIDRVHKPSAFDPKGIANYGYYAKPEEWKKLPFFQNLLSKVVGRALHGQVVKERGLGSPGMALSEITPGFLAALRNLMKEKDELDRAFWREYRAGARALKGTS